MTNKTRERWLTSAGNALLKKLFVPHGAEMPSYRVSVGWPRRGKKNTIGQCWYQESSDDQHCEIFISPKVDDADEVISILAHELVHASVGAGHGHRGPFRTLALSIGLEGKMTSTTAGEAFKRAVAPILKKIGPYPHAKLDGGGSRTKDGTRLIKGECPGCGYLIRTTRKWLEFGLPICPTCNVQMEG